MKPIATALAAAVAALVVGWYLGRGAGDAPAGVGGTAAASPAFAAAAQVGQGRDAAREAFERGARGRQLRVEGQVQRLLADDREGSPHQRFIIATDSGQTLLVAHNLDLAPRLDGLAVGDRVSIYGEYEWNDQGGVMHWTHDDPAGNHPAGYIDWNGRRFQ